MLKTNAREFTSLEAWSKAKIDALKERPGQEGFKSKERVLDFGIRNQRRNRSRGAA